MFPEMKRVMFALVALSLAHGVCFAERDPFLFAEKPETPAEKQEKRKAPGLQMILIFGDARYVVIDGEKLGVGDAWDGAVIIDISMNSVKLLKDGVIQERLMKKGKGR